jgi:hypothetical protein
MSADTLSKLSNKNCAVLENPISDADVGEDAQRISEQLVVLPTPPGRLGWDKKAENHWSAS